MHNQVIYRWYVYGMTRGDDIQRLIVGAHALTRMAALSTDAETPAAQWRTLQLLRDNGPLRIGELATLSRVSQPGMTRLAGQMVSAGLVEKSADEADSRVAVVSLTDVGKNALEAWLERLQGALLPFFADLDDAEWDAIHLAADVLARKTRPVEVAR